jgi:hypothetical protein
VVSHIAARENDPMKWFWKVRIYRPDGHYYMVEVETVRDLLQIDIMQDFYKTMTGCKMLLEGMSETTFGLDSIRFGFEGLWAEKARK